MAKREFGFSARFDLSRRDLIKYSIITVSVPTFVVGTDYAVEAAKGGGGPGGGWPEFLIKREADELLLKVRAIDFRLAPGSRKLRPLRWTSDHRLEFTFPPQHFSEGTIRGAQIPERFAENDLKDISLTPSAPSKLVFRVPASTIALRIEDLLEWSSFELLMPDVDGRGSEYDLEIPRLADEKVSRIEIPWGIELAPAESDTKLTFTESLQPRADANWTEIWSTALAKKQPDTVPGPLRMEVFSVRGFTRVGESGSIDDGTFVVSYRTTLQAPLPPASAPINNINRVRLAASLSRRFTYTGRVKPLLDSAQIRLLDEAASPIAAHEEGRAIAVEQLRLSGRGGSLDLLARFEPPPGSPLSSWSHSATMGRDSFVQIVHEGFLYPFGTPCQLVLVSQRVFGKDARGHFVAPLFKQAFLQVHQPNQLEIEHGESPFRSISITTERSPPLDLPASGKPDDYLEYDFFMPTVKGAPFALDHVGTDWGGEKHRASMPMVFVSNRAASSNGLIWEPGYAWLPTNPGQVFDPAHDIPSTGEGLRVVDRFWNQQKGRFANYGGAVINLARAQSRGSAAQKVDWVEWARGNVANLDPDMVVYPPFRPRARTMRIQPQAAGHLSGEKVAMLATYRDLRFTDTPFLDPEPTTPEGDYFANVAAMREGPDTPYLHFLETRPLVSEGAKPQPRSSSEVAADIGSLYYRTRGEAMPVSLFEGINNEIRFGQSQSADGIGGLSVPDTHASIANRRYGIVGDASFDERRWPGMAKAKPNLELADRLDFAAYMKTARSPLDSQPFDATRTAADRAGGAARARGIMGYAPPAAALTTSPAAVGPFAPGLKLGDLFGLDAEVIPGLRFSDVFRRVALAGSADTSAAPLVDGSERAAEPLSWDVKLTGIEWLTAIQEAGDDAPSLVSLLAELARNARPGPLRRPLSVGMEARLDWSNDEFKEETIGPARFIPTPRKTKIEIGALTRIDLGTPVIETNPPRLGFEPGKPKVDATAKLVNFAVEIFGAIRLNFASVSFSVAEDGSKSFVTKLASVELVGPLAFINQLQNMLGGLGEEYGMKLDISPQRARISQTLKFPAGNESLLIGPAQVTNLSLFWAVTIPLMGRDVLSVAFGISSREMPLTIFVPPWYGGKAYVLVEATTRGCRLIEVSMEYGALIPIAWGPARGQASLTAGIFYQLQRRDANDSATVELTGFVKAASHLTVAGIINFTGLIYIALTYREGGGEKIVRGTSRVRVSIKIGFVRYSYKFTAIHEKRQASGNRERSALVALDDANTIPALVQDGRTGGSRTAAVPFGRGYSSEARAAHDRLLAGFRSERGAA